MGLEPDGAQGAALVVVAGHLWKAEDVPVEGGHPFDVAGAMSDVVKPHRAFRATCTTDALV